MPNEQNLIPFHERTESEQRRIRSEGGRASGASRRKRKRLKEAVDCFFSLPIADEKLHRAMEAAGVDEEDCNYQTMIIMGLAKAAAEGDTKAAKVLFDALDDGKEESASQTANNMQALADILSRPAPNRKIKDFEE